MRSSILKEKIKHIYIKTNFYKETLLFSPEDQSIYEMHKLLVSLDEEEDALETAIFLRDRHIFGNWTFSKLILDFFLLKTGKIAMPVFRRNTV